MASSHRLMAGREHHPCPQRHSLLPASHVTSWTAIIRVLMTRGCREQVVASSHSHMAGPERPSFSSSASRGGPSSPLPIVVGRSWPRPIFSQLIVSGTASSSVELGNTIGGLCAGLASSHFCRGTAALSVPLQPTGQPHLLGNMPQHQMYLWGECDMK